MDDSNLCVPQDAQRNLECEPLTGMFFGFQKQQKTLSVKLDAIESISFTEDNKFLEIKFKKDKDDVQTT